VIADFFFEVKKTNKTKQTKTKNKKVINAVSKSSTPRAVQELAGTRNTCLF